MLATADRIPANTAPDVNARIAAAMDAEVHRCAHDPERISQRLRALEEEWDIERMLQANAATLGFAGTALAVLDNRRWLILPLLVTAFLFQHATQGWCPPLPFLRRMGYRTAREIDTERTALRVLRGDFGSLGLGTRDPDAVAADALKVARM